MKIKIPAKYAIKRAEEWFNWLQNWTNNEYEKEVSKAMERSWSNLYLGRSEKFAKWWLDSVHSGIYATYKERLKDHFWRTTSRAEEASRLAKIAIESGQEFVWADWEDIKWLENK